MNKSEFVKRAREVHGNKYNYSKVKYKNNKTRVCIICPEHGEFYQFVNNHLRGSGCPVCGKSQLTENEFLKRAKKLHGDKYDYSKMNFTNARTKIEIICPTHGSFFQTPSNHLQGKGCIKCGGKVKITKEEFIKRAKRIHGDYLDFSKAEYKNMNTPVCVICPRHGKFSQTPNNILHGFGCYECSHTVDFLTDEFIERARAVHGNKYDYSKAKYINSEIKVCIICPKHGEFWQSPVHHIYYKNKCPLCAGKKTITTEDFIKSAKEVYGDKYYYSKVKYINQNTKVCIICPKHGEFWQFPRNFLKSTGCIQCRKEDRDEKKQKKTIR